MVDAGAAEAVDALGLQLAPARAGRHHDASGRATCWPSSRSTRTRPSGPSASSTARWKLDSTASKRRACSVALRVSSRAGDPGREAEVVLDPRARAGLAAGRPGLGDERAQPLRAAVDGGSPARPARRRARRGRSARRRPRRAARASARPGRRTGCASPRWRARAPASPSAGCRATRAAAALSASVSTSYQRTGSRLRSSRSRTSNARREPRGAISRMTPCPSASCHARRASSVRKTCSPNSGQRATMLAQPGPVEHDHVGRLDRDAGADRRLAGEHRDVADERAAVGLRDVDVLAGLAVDELDQPASRSRRTARRGRRARRAPRRAGTCAARRAWRATRASRPRAAGRGPRRRGRETARCELLLSSPP